MERVESLWQPLKGSAEIRRRVISKLLHGGDKTLHQL